MSVYTVHAPPNLRADALPAAERIVFVRDGFSWWAFLLAPLWMLWHRMWLVLTAYVVLVAASETAMVLAGVSRAAIAVVSFFIALLVGLEASTLRRITLRRRGWNNVGVVSGHDAEDAERRFFGAWLQTSREADASSRPLSLQRSVPPIPRAAPPPDIIGLFPESGSGR